MFSIPLDQITIEDGEYKFAHVLPLNTILFTNNTKEFIKVPDVIAEKAAENNLLECMKNLPVGKRTDAEINTDFQALRDKWNNA